MSSRQPRRKPMLRDNAVRTLIRFLEDRGLSDDEIDRSLEYVEVVGARTISEGFVLAMSRALYSDEQLAGGMRFDMHAG